MLAVVAAIIVFVLVAPVRVHGDNMAPTLRDGDVVIIVKRSYSASRAPEYGEIVAFRSSFALAGMLFKYGRETDPDNARAPQEERRYRFGRVEGLPGKEGQPGDVMQVKGDALFRNGKQVRSGVGMPPPEAFAEADITKNEDGSISAQYAGGAIEATRTPTDEKTVADGTAIDGNSVFILNDDPDDYLDSREPEVDPILEDIRGKVVFRIWPINKFGPV
jgi:signal peptidase I